MSTFDEFAKAKLDTDLWPEAYGDAWFEGARKAWAEKQKEIDVLEGAAAFLKGAIMSAIFQLQRGRYEPHVIAESLADALRESGIEP